MVLASCAVLNLNAVGTTDKPISWNSNLGGREYDVANHFIRTEQASWLILTLIPLNQPDVGQIVQQEIGSAGGDGAVNVQITTKLDVLDIVISIFVGGLYNTRTVIIEGDVVKF